MIRLNPPRLEHLRRLTDSRGLIHTAAGECPDRFGGYSALDNADALRLCAQVSDAVQGERVFPLARTYFEFLLRARREDGRVHHACDAQGQWSGDGDDALVQSRLARALAAVIVSELPISLRLQAADWWRGLLKHAEAAHTACSAANWLIALGQLRSADPGRDLNCARRLAAWLVEDCYYCLRSPEWEWFESHWQPGAACIAEGLWSAARMLNEPQCRVVAETATRFLITHLFEADLCAPPGTHGSWMAGVCKPEFDQLPEDTAALTSLLCAAESVTGDAAYGHCAELAARWFAGNNPPSRSLIDPSSGACRDALRAEGAGVDCGATATVAYLLTEAARAARAAHTAEPPVYVVPISC